MTILIKEHFNRWYSLKAYYFALTLLEIPITVIAIAVCRENPIYSINILPYSLSVHSCSRSSFICGAISPWNGCASGCFL